MEQRSYKITEGRECVMGKQEDDGQATDKEGGKAEGDP